MSNIPFISVKEAEGLPVGARVEDFSAVDVNGDPFRLSDALIRGKVVLIFIRGQWCPFCNKHLRDIQKRLPEIYAKGASVVAVSPETSEFIKRTLEKTGTEFTLLEDAERSIAQLFGVNFRPGKAERMMYNLVLGADMKNAHGDDTEQLPIPATYVIDQQGSILWRHFDPDYKKRAKFGDILKSL